MGFWTSAPAFSTIEDALNYMISKLGTPSIIVDGSMRSEVLIAAQDIKNNHLQELDPRTRELCRRQISEIITLLEKGPQSKTAIMQRLNIILDYKKRPRA